MSHLNDSSSELCKSVFFLKKFFCKHRYKHIRNVFGDEINQHNGARSVWMCERCEKIQLRSRLHPEYILPISEKQV